MLVGERKVVPACLISTMIAFHLIREGCEAYLANIMDKTQVSLEVSEVLVVRDFSDMLLDELQGLPPYREVNFEIKTILGTTPISITPYRMTPTELKKLKKIVRRAIREGIYSSKYITLGSSSFIC